MYVSRIEDVFAPNEQVIVSRPDPQTWEVIRALATQLRLRVAGGIQPQNSQPWNEKGEIPLFHSYADWDTRSGAVDKETVAPTVVPFFKPETIFEEIEALAVNAPGIRKALVVGDNISMAVLKRILKSFQEVKVTPVFAPTYLLGYQAVYTLQDAEKMAWHYHGLDPDLEAALHALPSASGSFLDLGTGAGNQAIELAARGFRVTATDLTQKAFAKNARLHPEVDFIEDDILHTRLTAQFDYIFDRGCFHSLELADAGNYIRQVKGLLKPEGRLFLKSIYEDSAGPKIPNSAAMPVLEEIFKNDFKILKTQQTVYHASNIEVQPKAFFFIMQKTEC